jgi:ATP-binding cassette subfamily F protein 3
MADQAPSMRFHAKLKVGSEDRNRLNRDIILEEFTLATGVTAGRVLIDNSTLKLVRGSKHGLVGRNGVGKTTLLKALASHAIEGMYRHMRCVYVDDGTEGTKELSGEQGQTAIGYLLQKHTERRDALAELKSVMDADGDVDLDALKEIADRLSHLKADSADADARRLLKGLGVNADALLDTFSGGWRHRVALATALFVEADLLLLDEPTRSLDLTATAYLEGYLRAVPTTCVVVSHDLDFLDAFTTHITQLEDCRLKTYPGNHTAFLQALSANRAYHKRAYQTQESRRRRWNATIERLRERAERTGNAARQIRSRQISMEKRLGQALDGTYWKYSLMGPRPEIAALEAEVPVDFDLPTDVSDVPEAAGEEGETTLLRLCDVGYSFADGPEVLRDVSYDITLSTRLALVGSNGTGKTTLLRILAEDLRPSSGHVLRWDGLRVGYIRQEAAKSLQSAMLPVAWLIGEHPTLSKDEAVEVLRGFGLAAAETLTTPVANLSDGQRTRMLLASLQCDQPHVVLLDEPTGHLDAESAAALAVALDFFAGAVIVASHDRMFLRSLQPELLRFTPHGVVPFDGDIDRYCEVELKKAQRAAESAAAAKRKSAPAASTVASSGPDLTQLQPVTCRRCGGAHFTFSCEKPAGQSNKTASTAKPADAVPKVKVVQPAKDGKGNWRVVVSKSTAQAIQSRR